MNQSNNKPIKLGRCGMYVLEPADLVLYRKSGEENFALAEVNEGFPENVLGLYVTLKEDYSTKEGVIKSSEQVIAKHSELFWDRKKSLPVEKLEKLLEMANTTSRGSGVTVMI